MTRKRLGDVMNRIMLDRGGTFGPKLTKLKRRGFAVSQCQSHRSIATGAVVILWIGPLLRDV